jgi:hypothetical protein
MLRFFKTVGALVVLAFGLQPAFGFSLMGPPNQAWQVPTIGYNLPGDIGAPHNLGEEYRWNTPTIYYAYNQNFLDYFASNGVFAVDQAMSVLNGLTNFSLYSANLSEVPLQTRRINNTAQTLHLSDLKSFALYIVLEEIGLTDPERYVWTLRTRVTQPGLSCPFMIYGVIKLNFDPANWQPSSYVNSSLYSYIISEICSGPNPLAVTIPFPVDPLALEHMPVSSFLNPFTFNYGEYLTGMTRDDVGGLRYIYQTTNINWEAMSSDSLMFSTNVAGGQQLLLTSNLTLLASQALTNNAAALSALYPNLVILGTTNIFTNIWVTNLTAYFTNYPYDPFGTPPHLAFATNRTLTVQTRFQHTFGNVVTFVFTNGAWVAVPLPNITTHTGKAWITVQTTTVTNSPYDPFGTPPHTNTTSVTYLTNAVAGEYFIVPTNLCGIAISALQATVVSINTNIVNLATNVAPGATNAQFFTQTVLDYFTNHVFAYYPVDCLVSNVSLKQGIDKFTFVKTSYDSLVGRFYQPITNLYTLVTVTNSRLVTNWYQRVVTRPDFLFSAEDFTDQALAIQREFTFPNFNTNNENFGLAGPGNIDSGLPKPTGFGAVNITFNKVGPLLQNVYSTNFILNGLSQSTAVTNFVWGSYDGSTNAPIVYPNGSSIMNLEAQILFQIITPFLPDGKAGSVYPPVQLQATGGTPPYSWSWSAGVPMLPPGMSLSTGGVFGGTPTTPGTYVFNVTATGTDGLATIRTMQVIIDP